MYNEILTGQLNDILSKRLGMKGGGPAPTLAPEILPVLVVEADRPEWLVLGSTLMVGIGQLVATGAAVSSVRIRNPVNSGVLAVIERIDFDGDGGGQRMAMDLGPTETDLTTNITTVALDTRRLALAAVAGALRASSSNSVDPTGVGFNFWRGNTIDGSNVYDAPIVLTPGFALTIRTLALHALTCSARWYERAILTDERIVG